MSAKMTKEELIERASRMMVQPIDKMSVTELQQLMTVTQFITDICLNEIEDRDELTFMHDMPIVPYMCDHQVETILTRED